MPRLLLLALLLLPLPAWAHAILVESQPAAGGTAAAGPARIVLRFNSRIDHARSRLTLRRGGEDAVLPLDPASPADTLAAPAALRPGSYTVRWQVLAVDGHITRGEVPFTVPAP